MKSFKLRYCIPALLAGAVALCGQNLLTDPDFENGGSTWQMSSGSGRSIVTTNPQSGTHCQQAILSSGGTRRVWQDVTITAGTDYDASGWVRAGGTASASIVIFWLASGTGADVTAALQADTLDICTVNTWTRQTNSYTAPATATVAVFYLLGRGTIDTVWFDNVSFSVASSGTEGKEIAAPDRNLTVSPNPASRAVTLRMAQPAVEIAVYATNGARVAQVAPTGREITWQPAATLPNGVYTVKITTADRRSISRQVVISR
jgi:hypothetical protein